MIALAANAWLAPVLAATLQLSAADSVSTHALAAPDRPASIFGAIPPAAGARVAGAPVVLLVNASSRDPQVALAWKQPPGSLLALLHAVAASPRESCLVEWKSSRGGVSHETWWLDRERGLLVSRAPAPWRARAVGSTALSFRCPALGLGDFTGNYALTGESDVTSLAPVRHYAPEASGSDAADELPEAIRKVAPIYPPDAQAEGMVIVKARIESDGSVGDCAIVKSIPELDAAAIASVRLWQFRPALAHGKPVVVWVTVPVRFEKPR